jgi:ribonucleotide reductase alpha subunit
MTKVTDADLMGAFEVKGNNSMWKGKPDQTDVVGHGEPGVLAMLAKQKHQKCEQAQEKSKTWDDLVREGALLGIHQSELSHLAVHYGSKL